MKKVTIFRERKKWTPKDREGRPHEHTSSQRMFGLICIQAKVDYGKLQSSNRRQGPLHSISRKDSCMHFSHRTSALLHAHTHTHTHTHTQADWQLRRESSRPCETQAYSAQSNKPSHCSDIKQTINTNPISFNSWINGNRVDKTCKKIQKTLNYWEAKFKDQRSVVDHIEKTRNRILPITGLNKTNT